MTKVLFVAHDRGGANCLMALYHSECWPQGWTLDAMLAGPAKDAFAESLAANNSFEHIDNISWQDYKLIVTGTSGHADLEREAWLRAQEQGVHSVCIIDSWTNLTRRFHFSGSNALSLPDGISVIDSQCAKQLIQSLPANSSEIFVGGQPYLESVVKRNLSVQTSSSSTLLFCSEPMLQGYNKDGALGYDQYSVFSEIISQLATLPSPPKVLLKLHPLEALSDWDSTLKLVHPAVSVELVEGNIADYFSRVDSVVGLVSMALLEASLRGVKTLSCQFNRKQDVAPDVVKFSTVITDPSAFLSELRQPNTQVQANELRSLLTDSAKRIVNTVNGQLATQFSVRQATLDDAELLFDWVNDADVRGMAFDSSPISWQNHQQWFSKRIADSATRIYLGLVSDKEIGQVRLELLGQPGFALLDYSLDKEHRGQGLAKRLLINAIAAAIKDQFCHTIVAKVKPSNSASHIALTAVGFRLVETNETYMTYHF